MITSSLLLLFASPAALLAGPQTGAGEDPGTGFAGLGLDRPRVEVAWNRYYDAEELYDILDSFAETWPELISHEVIGHSIAGREMRVYTIHDPSTGEAAEKPAMWVDGNVHGNEIQGGEAVVYLAWYLLENHETNEIARDLIENTVFYLLPMQNPDGRASWFADAHSAHSSRTGVQPTDNDRDGRFDEDPPNDLDGDGHITLMRKHLPGEGTHRVNPDDPRLLEPVPANEHGIRGDWVMLGQEGIDDDGDGRTNEDGRGGYDMNRAWPSLWQPEHGQYGAGPYPLYWPETRSIARFLIEHPNVAGVQSFHNAGGMILRGPGAEAFGSYPRGDVRVYDSIGKDGEKMLPFYRYMIIWKDLYSVFGGFVTWTYEGLGIISFTNELWSNKQLYPDEAKDGGGFFGGASRDERQFFDDKLLLGAAFVDWHPVEHPLYGQIEVGGFRKDFSRVAPTFLIEEMIHRNALFCIEHARAMPRVSIETATVTELGGGLKAVDVVFRNENKIPTRTTMAADKGIGQPDVYTCSGRSVTVVAGGFRRDRWRPERTEFAERDPARLLREQGIPGRGEVRVRWLVRGSGDTVTVGWEGEKARNTTGSVKID